MSLVLIVYLIGLLDQLNAVITLAQVLLFFSIPCYCCYYAFKALENGPEQDSVSKPLKSLRSIIISLLAVVSIGVFVPSKDTAHYMLAAFAGEKLVTHEAVTEIGSKSLELLNKIIDEQLDKLEGDLE